MAETELVGDDFGVRDLEELCGVDDEDEEPTRIELLTEALTTLGVVALELAEMPDDSTVDAHEVASSLLTLYAVHGLDELLDTSRAVLELEGPEDVTEPVTLEEIEADASAEESEPFL